MFQYLMKLHYSQTCCEREQVKVPFQYLMKLHYSQTICSPSLEILRVSVPYEITLLSNNISDILRLFEFQYLMKLHYSQTDDL